MKAGAIFSCSSIQARERSCSGRRGSPKLGGCLFSLSSRLLASLNFGSETLTEEGLKSVLRRHPRVGVLSVRPGVKRRGARATQCLHRCAQSRNQAHRP